MKSLLSQLHIAVTPRDLFGIENNIALIASAHTNGAGNGKAVLGKMFGAVSNINVDVITHEMKRKAI